MRLVRVRGGRSYRSERRLSSTDLQRGTAQQDAGRGGITTSILFVQPAATQLTGAATRKVELRFYIGPTLSCFLRSHARHALWGNVLAACSRVQN